MPSKKGKKVKKTVQKDTPSFNQPWISLRTGRIIIAITSILMAGLTAIQVIPYRGWGPGILWSLFFGGMIWVIFYGMLFINRFLRR
ncbi:MAG: hypothetical protein ACP5QU_02025 [Anaerolineae bacterium]